MDWIHRHPYLTGFLVLAVIVLFFIFRGRSSSAAPSQGGPSEALQAANLGAQTQVQTAQLAAGVEQSKIAAAASAQSDSVKAALAAKQLDAATYAAISKYQTDAALNATIAQGNVATTRASYEYQTAQVQSGQAVQIASISAGATERISGLQAQIEALKSTNALSAQKDINATQLNISKVVAGVTIGQQGVDLHAIDVGGMVAMHGQDVQQNINASQQQTIRLADIGKVSVAKLAINMQGKVALAQTQVEQSQFDVQKQIVANQTNIANQLKAGGLGNKNRATIASLFFQGGSGAAQSIQYGGAATTGGMWAGISSIVGSIFGGGAPVHP